MRLLRPSFYNYITDFVEKQWQEFSPCHCLLNYIFNRNDKSEHITHLDDVFGLSFDDPSGIKGLRTLGKEKPNRSPAKRVRFGSEEQQNERAMSFVVK